MNSVTCFLNLCQPGAIAAETQTTEEVGQTAELHGHDEHAAHTAAPVALSTTLLFTGLLGLMIIGLALEEKIHAKKSVIVGVFAAVSLLLGTFMGLDLPFGELVLSNGHSLILPVYITAVDWGVIVIILGSSLFVDVTSKSGLFTWIAIKLTKTSGGDPLKLLIYYSLMTVIFSAVLNNVTAMIIVGSLTGVSLGKLKRMELLLGFLLIEGLLTNIGGLLTLISSVPNIIVGTTAGIGFVQFFLSSVAYVVVATAVTVFMGAKLFSIKSLANESERLTAQAEVSSFDENDGVESWGFFKFAVAALIGFVVCIAFTSQIPGVAKLGMGFVALFFALVVMLRYKHEVDKVYKAVDWDLLGFFACLFVVIHVMEYAQVLGLIGQGLTYIIDLGDTMGPAALLFASAAFSSVTDNIPLAAMLANILGKMPEVAADSPLWWSVIFGANLGGNLTPIGSASTLVAVTIIHKYKLPMTFGGFVIKALPFAAVQIVLAIIYVLLFLR